MTEEKREGLIRVEAAVEMEGRHPIVRMMWHDMTARLETNDARALGGALLECADAAEHDSFLVEFALEHLHLPEEGAHAMLRQFRNYRLIKEEIGT